MKIRNGLALLVTAIMLTAVTASAKITTDYDHKTNFARYKTYSWAKVETSNSLWDQRVKDAVNSQLAARGWSQVPEGGDMVVSARGVIRDEQQLNTFYNGFGGRRFGGFGNSTTTVDTYKVGSLIVDMFDGSTKNMLWRGMSSDTLSDNPDKNAKNLDKNVQKMFQHFPPGSDQK